MKECMMAILIAFSTLLFADNEYNVCNQCAATIGTNIGVEIYAYNVPPSAFLSLSTMAAINAKLHNPVSLPTGYTALTDNDYQVKVTHTATAVFATVRFWGSSNISTVDLPTEIILQNYPNPFNPTTTISFNLPVSGEVKLSVFNANGQLVKELINGFNTSGDYSIEFNAGCLNSGVYYYKLETPEKTITKKMLLVK